MWNFLPEIHGRMGEGLDRYRVFNLGRFDAFAGWFGADGPGSPAPVLPAASAVGHYGDHLVVSALGLRTQGAPVENPRQTPAFAYSRAHGPRPPCFARATVVRLPAGPRLLVSGTASIRGEDSVHPGSLTLQLAETFENIDRLARCVRGTDRFDLTGIESARVYFPRPADRTLLASSVSARLPVTASVEFFPAWVCRPELLVEIEATLAPSPC
jgi:enamine deaminase RidA (YjgF/YER057c/UK114 family)